MSKDSSQNLSEDARKTPEDTRQASEDTHQISEDTCETSEDTHQISEDTCETSENSAEIRSEHSDILDFLWEGQKSTKEIANHLSVHESTARTYLVPLRSQGKIVVVKKGTYRLGDELAPWTERKNEKIIDSLMKLYEKVLKQHLQQEDISQNDLKGLILMADRLMKRWYLVHRGYDSNTRQAVEDAKQKTESREKQALEGLPPAEQLEVVGDYDVEMRGLLESLPEAEKKKITV